MALVIFAAPTLREGQELPISGKEDPGRLRAVAMPPGKDQQSRRQMIIRRAAQQERE
jgi:hypothetical protein